MSTTTLLHRAPAARLRAAARAGVVAAVTSAPLLAATAAMAASSNHTYDGEDSGQGLTVLQTIGIFVCIPVGLFLLIAFLVMLPGWVRGDSNRREVGWTGAAAKSATQAKAAAESGPSAPASSAAEVPDEGESVTAGKAPETGGASGSW